jgi:hypothetical protein
MTLEASAKLVPTLSLTKLTYEPLSRNNISFKYALLDALWHRSLRNGSWNTLTSTRKALYRCALWVAKAKGCISNKQLIEQVLQIVYQLLRSVQSRIASTGEKRARMMLETYEKPHGVFSWAPQVREWLLDSLYVFYLGVNTQP